MSSWEVKVEVNLNKLEELASRLDTIPSMMEDVAEQIKTETVNNINQKDIVDTGWLRDHIGYEMKDDGFILSDFDTTYGIYNEFGTHRMAARPFMTPAAEKFGEICNRTFIELIK